MDLRTKSVVRKVRRMISKNPSSVEDYYALGKMASGLIPAWLESDWETLEDYLRTVYLGQPIRTYGYYYGRDQTKNWAGKVALMALTYYEVPSLTIWEQLGYAQTARCAQYPPDKCRDIMAENGVSPLDLIVMKI